MKKHAAFSIEKACTLREANTKVHSNVQHAIFICVRNCVMFADLPLYNCKWLFDYFCCCCLSIRRVLYCKFGSFICLLVHWYSVVCVCVFTQFPEFNFNFTSSSVHAKQTLIVNTE